MSVSSTLNSPLAQYREDQVKKQFQADAAQEAAVRQLEQLACKLIEAERPRSVWQQFTSLFKRKHKAPVTGLYLWGGVGRGKTYLMDLFYDALPFERKLRTHFHRFMRGVHHELKALDGVQDPLELIAEKFAKRHRVICFDEFFVVDITDAMILAGLLDGLFRRGVTLVATSNIKPDRLYKDGLQRARFVPAIRLLNEHTRVLNVDGGTDYRLRTLKQSRLYHSPLGEAAEAAIEQFFDRLVLSEAHVRTELELNIEGRDIRAKKEADGVVWFEFKAICDGPRSQNDYIELAREYQTILIENVPVFSEKNDDQARRFIYLVDEFYDRKVKLFLTAEKPFYQLYQSGRLGFEFQRTQSRLQEMQSEAYLSSAHKG